MNESSLNIPWIRNNKIIKYNFERLKLQWYKFSKNIKIKMNGNKIGEIVYRTSILFSQNQ